MIDPVELLVDALAAYRLTRLVTADTITEAPRRAIVEWAGMSFADDVDPVHEQVADARAEGIDIPKLADLLTCRWCAGVWCAGGVVFARMVFPKSWGPVARLLAVSAAAALVAGLEDG